MMEHYISNKVFISRERIMAFLRMLTGSHDVPHVARGR